LLKEDKMSSKIASMLVALSFVFVGASAALAQVKDKSPVAPVPGGPIIVVPKCPQGWHVQPGSEGYGGKGFACVPNKPQAKIKCAPNFQYWEKECAFGCSPMIK
jgi:hypothetical protein